MTKFNFLSIPPLLNGFSNESEKRAAPEILSKAFYGHKPMIAGAVAKLKVAAATNPGIEPAPERPAGFSPAVVIKEIEGRDRIREAVTGNDILAPVLGTSHKDWMLTLEAMSEEARLEEIRNRVAEEAISREHPRAA